MNETEDHSERRRPKGLMAKLAFPTIAVGVMVLSVVGIATEFTQNLNTPPDNVGYKLVTSTMSKDAPETVLKTAVATVEPVAPVESPKPVVAPASARRTVPAADSPALAAIRAVAPQSAAPARAPGEDVLAYGAPADEGTGRFLVVTGNGPLNVRSGPSRDEDKVLALAVGDRVEVMGEAEGWTRIRDDAGRIGWASSEFMLDPAEAERIAAAPPVEEVAGETMTARSGVNVRSGAGRGNRTVFTLGSGEKVVVTDRKDGWMEIRTSAGKVGWVYNTYLR